MDNTQKPSLSAVENAFQPASEVRDVERFAGRKDAIKESYYALMAAGSHIAVVGNRGIGKSSLARQLIRIANGDNSLLKKLDIPTDPPLDYVSVYFACGDQTKTTADLLQSIITSKSALGDWIYEVPKAREIVNSYAPNFRFNAGPLTLGLDAERSFTTTSSPVIDSHAIDTIFTNITAAVAEKSIARDGIFIVVDEFDQVADPKGFASFLKAISTNVPSVKFCLVGVAHDIHDLMKEHPSADRLFAGSIVALPSMSPIELMEIVRNAEKSIANYITFTKDGTARLVGLAQGHPYMIHLIGKYALRDAFGSDRRTIDMTDVDHTVRTIAERGADPVLEGRYKRAVTSSAQREVVLKALAETQGEGDGEVRTSNAYKIAFDQGVENASQYVGQLTSDDFGAEVEKVRERVYRFKDSLFAAYAKLRPMHNASIS